MVDQTENLRLQIRSMVRVYEGLFTEKKPMPESRCLDVVDLRVLLDKPYSDLDECIEAVRQRLSTMKTGWWIFKTGRSRLKSSIEPILEAYENPVTQHLVAQLLAITQSFSEVVNQLNEVKARTIAVPISPVSSPLPERVEEVETSLPLSISVEDSGCRRWFGRGGRN